MSYEIVWHPKALQRLEKLPKNISQRIVEKVKTIKENPFHFLEHFEGGDYYKLRVGDYRLLVDVDNRVKLLKSRCLTTEVEFTKDSNSPLGCLLLNCNVPSLRKTA